ncbi:MAG: purine-cytosine permease family protein [Anaerovoracaceae bacterium]|jgi:NCS1 family nucleobase:cation symporter-1
MSENKAVESSQNKEAQFGLLPVLKHERIWGFLDYTYTNVSFAIATWAFLIGGNIAMFVNFKEALIATFAGNLIAVLIMAAATTTPSSKYGFDIYTGFRSFFGSKGNVIILGIITIVQVAWVAILSIMFGRAVMNVVTAVFGIKFSNTWFVTIMGIVSVFICWAIVCKGPGLMRLMNRIIAPCLFVVMVVMIVILNNSVGFSEIMSANPIVPFDNKWLNFMIAFELNLGAGFSWLPNMGGLARITKNARASYWPNLIGLVGAATFGTMIGVSTALVLNSTDPTEWMVPLAGPALGIAALGFICFANLAANTVVSYNFCLGLKQVHFFMKQSWVKTTGIFFLPVLVLLFWPNQLYNNFYILLAFACTLYAPLSAIYLIDYFLLRKQNISLRDIYNRSETSGYYYWNGVNWVTVLVFVLGMASYIAFLNPLTLVPNNPLFSYITATGFSFIFTAALYYIATKFFVISKGKGNY